MNKVLGKPKRSLLAWGEGGYQIAARLGKEGGGRDSQGQ